MQDRSDEELLKLKILNLEVRGVFVKHIREYFKESVKADTGILQRFECVKVFMTVEAPFDRIFSLV